MDITDSGITQLTFSDRMDDAITKLLAAFPRINLSQASYTYQLLKLQVLREMNWQETLTDYFYQLDPTTATGIWLDIHLNRNNLRRTPAQYAYVYVWVQGLPIGTEITSDAIFSTTSGISFSPVTEQVSELYVANTRTSDSDSPPTNYRFSSIAKITSDKAGASEYSGWTFDEDTQVIDWSSSSTKPAIGGTYYIFPDSTYSKRVFCRSVSTGSNGNVSAGSISGFVGIGASSVTNESSAYGGADIESDELARGRLFDAMYGRFSASETESDILDIEGVQAVSVQEILAVDQKNPSSWDTAPAPTTYAKVPSWSTIEQPFTPGNQVSFLNSVDLSVGTYSWDAPSVAVSLLYAGTSLATTNLTPDMLDSSYGLLGSGGSYQEVSVPLKHGPLDNSLTYSLYIQGSGGTKWELSTGGDYGQDMYVNGTALTGSGLAFKTRFKSPAIKVTIDTLPGYTFSDIQTLVEDELDDNMLMIGIDYTISQTSDTYLSFTFVVDVVKGYTSTQVISNVESELETYIATLKAGDIVPFNKIVSTMMNGDGVRTIRRLVIEKDDLEVSSYLTQYDITISTTESPKMGEVTGSVGIIR